MDNIIEITNSDGSTKKYRVICTYHSDESNKDYLAYTDDTYNYENQLNILASEYNPNEDETPLKEITDKEDFKQIKLLLEKLTEGEK